MVEKAFVGVFCAFHLMVIAMYATCTKYGEGAALAANSTDMQYSMFQDVHIMIFMGFGLLMTFLFRNGYTTTGHSFMIAAFAGLWAILCLGFWEHAWHKNGAAWTKIELTFRSLINADYAAAAVLISFCALLGRFSALQLLVTAFFEIIVYSLNVAIAEQRYRVADIGGSMLIHMFGCYFGLSLSFVLEKIGGEARAKISHKDNRPTPVSDTFAMIGTLFLWCFWPSFNAALSSGNQSRTVINTYLSLVSSCLAAFYVCVFVYHGKFRMVEIQNSTLAGGVAIGATADYLIDPWGALLIGMVCGAVSVLGYKYLTPFLHEKFGLKDTCGINNLHGMPAIIGATCSCIAAACADESKYGHSLTTVFSHREERTAATQARFQVATLFTTLGLAIAGGLLTGVIVSFVPALTSFFTDDEEWLIEEGEECHECHCHAHKTVKEVPAVCEPISS